MQMFFCINKQRDMHNEKIIYPSKFEPSNCPVFVRNEIEIKASPERVWFWLTNASTWHEWYFNASRMHIINQHSGHLLSGTKFTWKTFGANLQSEVKEFEPHQRLAWDAKGMGILVYHAWLIVPTGLQSDNRGNATRLGMQVGETADAEQDV